MPMNENDRVWIRTELASRVLSDDDKTFITNIIAQHIDPLNEKIDDLQLKIVGMQLKIDVVQTKLEAQAADIVRLTL